MIKKKDPYLAILDFYYERFPEPITFEEAYNFFHQNKFISEEELIVFKGGRISRDDREWPEKENSIRAKKRLFDTIFQRAGDGVWEGSRHIGLVLNSDHYFHRLDYIELTEARKSSRNALIVSFLAIGISLISGWIAWDNAQRPVSITNSQIQEIVSSIKDLKTDVRGK